MKPTIQTLRVPVARPRNPFVVPTRARKGGRHDGGDPKTASRQRLARLLERLDPQGP